MTGTRSVISASSIPNILSVIRILMVLPTSWLLWQHRYVEAFVLVVIAGASDGLDGYLARRFNWRSRLGEILDPLADKFLVAAMFIIFTLQGYVPLWVPLIVLGRDLVILGGAGVYRLLFGELEINPTFVSKANTAMQLVTLCLLAAALLPFGPVAQVAAQLVEWCFIIVAVLGVCSGVDYVVRWGIKAVREGRRRRSRSADQGGAGRDGAA